MSKRLLPVGDVVLVRTDADVARTMSSLISPAPLSKGQPPASGASSAVSSHPPPTTGRPGASRAAEQVAASSAAPAARVPAAHSVESYDQTIPTEFEPPQRHVSETQHQQVTHRENPPPRMSTAHHSSGCPECSSSRLRIRQLQSDLEDTLNEARVERQIREEMESRLRAAVTAESEARTQAMREDIKRAQDAVIEAESLRAKLARVERERDVYQFQLQESERRAKHIREEETVAREEAEARAAEAERRAANAELQRARSLAECTSAKGQTEFWRSAARRAEDEAAAFSAQLELMRQQESRFRSAAHLSTSSVPYAAPRPAAEPQVAARPQPLDDVSSANSLSERQSRAARTAESEQNRSQAVEALEAKIRDLEDQMESFGPPVGRTLAARLEREQIRKATDAARRELAALTGGRR